MFGTALYAPIARAAGVAAAPGAAAGIPVISEGPPSVAVFTPAQRALMTALSERVLPTTDTPGAIAAGVPAFIEKLLADWAAPADRVPILAGLDAIEWAARAAELGAGEILLNAMDADGTTDGFDLELIRAVRREVSIPVIASGGAGRAEDFPPAVEAGAQAVLAASVFHFGTLRIADVKAALSRAGHPART